MVGVAGLVAAANSTAAAAPGGTLSADEAPAANRAAAAAAALVAGRPGVLHAGPDDRFVQQPVQSSLGWRYVPYDRTYRGLPVVGGDFVVVVDPTDRVSSVSVAQRQAIKGLGTTPTLGRAEAEQIAAGRLTSLSAAEGSRLVVYALGAQPQLAWETTVEGVGADGASRLIVDVNAVTGAVLDSQETIARGEGTGHYNGPGPLSVPTSIARFGDAVKWSDSVCVNNNETCAVGDVNHDGRADAVAFVKSTQAEPGQGDVLVALSTGTGLNPPVKWSDSMCLDNQTCAVADVNGDGRADAVAFVKSTQVVPGQGDVLVALSTGTGFDPPVKWSDSMCLDNQTCAVADVNGDHKADALAFVKSTQKKPGQGDVLVALSTGTGFDAPVKWSDSMCLDNQTCAVADVNGDGRADAVAFVKSTQAEPGQGDVLVALSTGARFDAPVKWSDSICLDNQTCAVADVNGDGNADAVAFVNSSQADPDRGDVWVALANDAGTGFASSTRWADSVCVDGQTCDLADFNKDGNADVVAFVKSTLGEPNTGDALVALSSVVNPALGPTPPNTYTVTDPTTRNLICKSSMASGKFGLARPDDVWGNGDPTDLETICTDAMFAAKTEERMVLQQLGRAGLDGRGGAWPLNVADPIDTASIDLFGGLGLTLGTDLDGGSLTSIDVVAHELGHGIDSTTPSSTSGLSKGGTQEFIADVFGTATEFFANQAAPFDTPDYVHDDQHPESLRRYMYNPALHVDLRSGNPDANCYDSSVPTMEVHRAAGVGNHWFYLLAEGTNPTDGQPTSPTCNSSIVSGIGIQNALKILYNAMLMKTSSSSYPNYRLWTLTAAKNLFPGNCNVLQTVSAAWDAVSVPAQPGEPTCVPVPNVIGLSRDTATSIITGAGFVIGTVTTQASSSPFNTVIAQSPQGTALLGSAVNITISGVIVPSVVGFPKDDAISILTGLGLVVTVSGQVLCISPGDVMSQSPSGGTFVSSGSTVHILYDSSTFAGCGILK
jgi:Zn-dependent metalloprotease